MKNKCENFDERQLWIRGDIFKHGYITLGTLLILTAFIKDSSIINFKEDSLVNFIILSISIMIISVEMILKDVYFYDNKKQKILIYIMGILSSLLLIYVFL